MKIEAIFIFYYKQFIDLLLSRKKKNHVTIVVTSLNNKMGHVFIFN